jgi:hypothetical protein
MFFIVEVVEFAVQWLADSTPREEVNQIELTLITTSLAYHLV